MALHIYLSPHLDDAVFACGGLMANQVAEGGTVTVLTAFAGDPDPGPLSEFALDLHRRWGGGPDLAGDRRTEDRMACGRLGASVVHLPLPDAIYRRGPGDIVRYPSEESILGPPHPADAELVDDLRARLVGACPLGALVYSPSAIGGHVDHRVTRIAAERLGRPLWYYQDFPYAARGGTLPPELGAPPGQERLVPLSPEEIQSWASAASEYSSQISTFWHDEYTLYDEIRSFHDRNGGVRLLAPLSESEEKSVSRGMA